MNVTRAVVLYRRMALEGGAFVSEKCLRDLRGVLRTLEGIGIRDVCIVDGPNAESLETALAEPPSSLAIRVLANRSWRHATGSALLVARSFIESSTGPVLVVRGDRGFEPEVAEALCGAPLSPYDALVAVSDAALERRSADASRVRVRLRQVGRPARTSEVSQLGLDLEPFDALSCGHAVIDPELMGELESLPNPTIEDGIAAAIAKGAWVRAVLVSERAMTDDVGVTDEVTSGVEALLGAKAHPRYTLLNPGPVNTTASVKSALVHHDVCHRDSSFSELMVALTSKLRRIFRGGPRHSICMITGSGTAAMECAVASAVPRDGKILVIDNGAFGQRLLEVAALHQMDTVHLRYPWGDEVQVADVERMFNEHPDIDVVAMVHHETSVGLLNPVREIGALCQSTGALFIVDAVSSLGAEDIDVVRDHIDICYASANKCLHAISGAGFVCVAPRVWSKIEGIPPRSYYLDLKRYRDYLEERAQTPFTPAVSAYFALDAACREFLAEGHRQRLAMYRRRNRIVRDGLARLGMVPLTRTSRESNSVVTASVPQGLSYYELYEGLKARGYIIYGCKDVLAERFFQVANMGDIKEDDIRLFLIAVEEVLEVAKRAKTRSNVHKLRATSRVG